MFGDCSFVSVWFINDLYQVGSVKCERKLRQLLGYLEQAVNQHALGPTGPRLVCDSLLNSDKLSYNNPDHWVLSFQLVSYLCCHFLGSQWLYR